MITFDPSIGLGGIIQTAIFLAGGIYALGALRSTVFSLKEEVAESKRETKESIGDIQSEIKKIGEVLINQADQNRRIIHLEDDVRELRHYRGFVNPPETGGVDFGATG